MGTTQPGTPPGYCDASVCSQLSHSKVLVTIAKMPAYCHVLIAVFAFCIDPTASSIVVTPDGSITRPIEGTLVMTCEVFDAPKGTPCPVWISPEGREIWDTDGRMYVEGYGHTKVKLYVTSLIIQDAGLWQCQTSLPDGDTIQDNITLGLISDVRFVETPKRQSLVQGKDMTIQCRVAGVPTPEVTWRFMGDRVDHDKRHMQVREGLEIIGVRRPDRGNYTCRAEVAATGDVIFQEIHVTIEAKPMAVVMTSSARGRHSHVYKLTWDNPGSGDRSLPIRMYKIKYRELNVREDGVIAHHGPWTKKMVRVEAGETVNHYMLNGLQPKTVYGVWIKAKNKLGWSPRTAKFSFTTAE